MRTAKRFVILFSLSWILGCGGNELAGGTGMGNPPLGKATLILQVLQSSAGAVGTAPIDTITALDSTGLPIRLNQVQMNVLSIKVELPDTGYCEMEEVECDEAEFRVPGPFVADLLTGELNPEPEEIILPSDRYQEFEISIGPAAGTPIPSQLDSGFQTYSIILRGMFDYSDKQNIPIEIYLKLESELEFEHESGLELSTDSTAFWIFRFDVTAWLEGVNLSVCAEEALIQKGSNTLTIDNENPCGDVRERMIQNFPKSTLAEMEIEHH